jgi:hypothetical protein
MQHRRFPMATSIKPGSFTSLFLSCPAWAYIFMGDPVPATVFTVAFFIYSAFTESNEHVPFTKSIYVATLYLAKLAGQFMLAGVCIAGADTVFTSNPHALDMFILLFLGIFTLTTAENLLSNELFNALSAKVMDLIKNTKSNEE